VPEMHTVEVADGEQRGAGRGLRRETVENVHGRWLIARGR
jgi:hypothetical protein